MNSNNPTFEHSLRCLQHPASLAAIALLIVNDHVFKIISPSCVTGKLSDFAGLFFFPFVVAGGLGLLIGKERSVYNPVGALAFGVVGAWFLLLKTTHVVNSITGEIISMIVGAPTMLLLDPSDLMALAVLVPAWKLWTQNQQRKPTFLGYVSLGIGLIGSLATSPALPPFDNVTALAYEDGVLYAAQLDQEYVARSRDMGVTWESSYSRPDWEIHAASILRERELPAEACDPVSPEVCYRIEGSDAVFSSRDGGVTWEVSWQIPQDRREFVARVSEPIRAQDLIIAEQAGARHLFVAMGPDGILRKELPEGEWERRAVAEAEPAPLQSTDLITSFSIVQKELWIWYVLTLLGMPIANAAINHRLPGASQFLGLAQKFSTALLLTIAIVTATVLVVIGLVLLAMFTSTPILAMSAVVMGALAPLVWQLRTTRHVLQSFPLEERTRRAIMISVNMMTFAIPTIGSLAWLAWAHGVIAAYGSALAIALSATVLIMGAGYYQILRTK